MLGYRTSIFATADEKSQLLRLRDSTTDKLEVRAADDERSVDLPRAAWLVTAEKRVMNCA